MQSGPWPFYRLVIVMLCWGSINQVIAGPPKTIVDGFPHWMTIVYTVFMLVGTIMILVPIQFMRQNLAALNLERAGSWIFVGSVTVYLTNYLLTEGYPASPNVTVFFAFLIYPIYRVRQLNREIKEARKQKKEMGL
ncbi:membrane protein [Gordonia phage Suzy]|uniref:Membrane protein n=1 Tax=Gordonia phage Suzy TaxID=2201430 RepID=A0A2Z4Q7S7_9CAUD|nr:membrane protein [Gordonia phage Suzy]AWY06137.1 membrane protein [Gordonia phage Suzy]